MRSSFCCYSRNPNGLPPRMPYGATLLSLNRYDEAAAQFEEAVRISPNVAAAHKFLGMALSGLGQNDDAVRELKEAMHLDPSDDETREKLMELSGRSPK